MNEILILGIESSCDDTAAAVIRDRYVLSSKVADQEVHRKYGGVVPELASRAHQQNIIPVVDSALREAGCSIADLSAIAFTRGPGLMGSLLVGTSFVKGMALATGLPILEINHLQAHILVHFLKEKGLEKKEPSFPFICLLVSGGHTELVIVRDTLDMEVVGRTIDDAAGEAFDKCAKIMGIPYPGGPLLDKIAAKGNPDSFTFARPKAESYDFSYSGLKTSFLYFLRDSLRHDADFINNNKPDLCASVQKTIVGMLLDKLILLSEESGIREIALAGGVSANSALRAGVKSLAEKYHWNVYIPPLKFTTDNAAMIAIAGYYKYLREEFAPLHVAPAARLRY
jgi:N6-L-threonylcarbamoyladenine synthase